MQSHFPSYGPQSLDQQRQALESLLPTPRVTLGQQLRQIGAAIVNVLAPQDNLHIQVRDRHGRTVWSVYDRTTQQRQQFHSEEALRRWLDQRYYR